jgi:hypothetical protein
VTDAKQIEVTEYLKVRAAQFNPHEFASAGIEVPLEDLVTVGEEALRGQLECPRSTLLFKGPVWAVAEFSMFSAAPAPTALAWPKLLSGEGQVSLTPDEVTAELDLLFDVGHNYPDEGLLVYSVQVVSPVDWRASRELLVDLPSPAANPNVGSVGSGYFYHGLLYPLGRELRQRVIRNLVSTAEVLGLVLIFGGMHRQLRPLVRLTRSAEPPQLAGQRLIPIAAV